MLTFEKICVCIHFIFVDHHCPVVRVGEAEAMIPVKLLRYLGILDVTHGAELQYSRKSKKVTRHLCDTAKIANYLLGLMHLAV